MKSIAVAALVLAALAAAQDIYGIFDNELVYFGDVALGYWYVIGKPFQSSNALIPLIQVADVDIMSYTFYGIAADASANFAVDLVGLSLFTGQMVQNIQLPYVLTRNFVNTPGLDWIEGTEDVLVYGLIGYNDDGSANFQIIRISPWQGTNTTVASWTSFHEIQSVDAYDPSTGLLWIQTEFDNNLWALGWDVSSGQLMYNLSDVYGMQNLNYNPITHTIVGIGAPTGGYTPIVSLDSSSGTYTVLGQVEDEWTIAGPSNAGVNAIEAPLGIMYLYGNNGQIHFLAIDIQAQTVQMIPFNNTYSVYPTTIAWASFESASAARQKVAPYTRPLNKPSKKN